MFGAPDPWQNDLDPYAFRTGFPSEVAVSHAPWLLYESPEYILTSEMGYTGISRQNRDRGAENLIEVCTANQIPPRAFHTRFRRNAA